MITPLFEISTSPFHHVTTFPQRTHLFLRYPRTKPVNITNLIKFIGRYEFAHHSRAASFKSIFSTRPNWSEVIKILSPPTLRDYIYQFELTTALVLIVAFGSSVNNCLIHWAILYFCFKRKSNTLYQVSHKQSFQSKSCINKISYLRRFNLYVFVVWRLLIFLSFIVRMCWFWKEPSLYWSNSMLAIYEVLH